MGRKDHLVTLTEVNKISKRITKRNNAVLFQSVAPTIASQINSIGATSKTPDQVLGTGFPILNPIDEIGKNLSAALDIDLSLPNPFHCLELSDVGATVTDLAIDFLNLVKNKAETFWLDITKDPGNVADPTITFDPPVSNLPTGFPGAESRYLLEKIARETPTETRYEVVNDAGITGAEFFGPWTADHDAGGFSLNNILSLDIEDSAGTTNMLISAPLGIGGRFTFNVGEEIRFTENITDRVIIDAAGINLLTHDLFNTDRVLFDQSAGDALANADAGITSDATGSLSFNIPTSAQYNFTVNNAVPAVLVMNATTLQSQTIAPAVDDGDDIGTALLSWRFGYFNDIVSGGAQKGIINIGEIEFVNNAFSPSFATGFYATATDMFVRTGGGAQNLTNVLISPLIADLDFADFDILQVDNITTGADNTHVWTLSREATLADDTVIGTIRSRAFDGIGTINDYARIDFIMKQDVNTNESGSINFYPTENGDHAGALYLEINGDNLLEHIQFHRNLVANAELRMQGNTIILDTDLTTSIDGNTTDQIAFATNSSVRLTVSNTATIVSDQFTVLGNIVTLANGSGDFINMQAPTRYSFDLSFNLSNTVAVDAAKIHLTRFDSNSFGYNVPTGYTHHFLINGGDKMRIATDTIDFNNPLVFPTTNALGNTEFGMGFLGSGVIEINSGTASTGIVRITVGGSTVADFGDLTAAFMQMPEEASDPAAGTLSGKFYVKTVSGNAEPFFIGDGTTATSLLGGGGSQTPWVSTIDGDGEQLIDVGAISMRIPSAVIPAAAAAWLAQQSNSFVINAPTGDDLEIRVGGVNKMTIANTLITMTQDLDMSGDDILMGGADIREIDDMFFNAGNWDIRTTSTSFIINNTSGSTNTMSFRKVGIEFFGMSAGNDILFGPPAGGDVRIQTGAADRLAFIDNGDMTFTASSSQDIIFKEGGTETGRFDGGLNLWRWDPQTTFEISIAGTNKISINAGDITVKDQILMGANDVDFADGGYIDFANDTASAGTLDDFVTIKVNGVFKKLQYFNFS